MAIEDGEYIGVSELAAAVGEELAEIAQTDKRMKSGATEIPTERTIRFYLEKGLLPKPSKRLGQTLVFGRVHMLHLLVIKKLQSEGVPLSSIPDILKKKGRTQTQLEGLLNEDVVIVRSRREPDRQRPSQLEDLDVAFSLALPVRKTSEEPPPAPPPSSSGAKSYLKSLLSTSAKEPAREEEGEILFSMAPPEAPVTWTRHEPAIGVEINISDDYEAPTDEPSKAKLLERLRQILGI